VQWMSSAALRQRFLDYFEKKAHTIVSSSSLVPRNDPTLLFTNAGMVQFKDVFLGLEKASYTRATSSQRCVRAGGKHNDLEQVGYTKRHHTFFEMLGNFSFGDYFKREAIAFAWEFLTNVLEIPKERLWITVFKEDPESEAIWLNELKVDPTRFSRCGEKDNFWSMGDTGPCGPCTEIFYDHGPEIAGGPPGSIDQDGDRYVEIWNLVFMQFNRDIHGKLTPLPKPCVDTGMGLERIAAVMQGVHDNYDIDLFQCLLEALSKILGRASSQDPGYRVIVDHIRAAAFLIMDGISPSNEGRGYVLRRIIRRAARQGHKLGTTQPFFYKLTPAFVQQMAEAYPQLKDSQAKIADVIHQEEIQFSNTLEKGLKILDQELEKMKGNGIPGELMFRLYDTYGFPPDLTMDIAHERNLTVDRAGFEKAMTHQRERSQQTQQFGDQLSQLLSDILPTKFTGYEQLVDDAEVTALFHEDQSVQALATGQKGVVVLNQTPFYAESGGQVGDTGSLCFETGRFQVEDTQKKGKVYLHYGEIIAGNLTLRQKVHAEVDLTRIDTILNHSATHLLHEALRQILGSHVVQKGSLVEAKRLRFDFSHPNPLTLNELKAIEQLVNLQIRKNLSSGVTVLALDDAKKSGALALFGEKYESEVRVVKMGDFSKEVCGGTHVHHTGEIGLFKIISESASASGIRRIEAVTGNEALLWIEKEEEILQQASNLLKTNAAQLSSRITQLLEENKNLTREIERLKHQDLRSQSETLLAQTKDIQGIKVLAAQLNSSDRDTLRNALDQLKSQLEKAVIVLASVQDQKVILVAGVTKNCLPQLNAVQVLNHVAAQLDGKGGGRPDLAQGGGEHPEKLPQALASVENWVAERI
jgi:alanyl-tRNA synthetase